MGWSEHNERLIGIWQYVEQKTQGFRVGVSISGISINNIMRSSSAKVDDHVDRRLNDRVISIAHEPLTRLGSNG